MYRCDADKVLAAEDIETPPQNTMQGGMRQSEAGCLCEIFSHTDAEPLRRGAQLYNSLYLCEAPRELSSLFVEFSRRLYHGTVLIGFE